MVIEVARAAGVGDGDAVKINAAVPSVNPKSESKSDGREKEKEKEKSKEKETDLVQHAAAACIGFTGTRTPRRLSKHGDVQAAGLGIAANELKDPLSQGIAGSKLLDAKVQALALSVAVTLRLATAVESAETDGQDAGDWGAFDITTTEDVHDMTSPVPALAFDGVPGGDQQRPVGTLESWVANLIPSSAKMLVALMLVLTSLPPSKLKTRTWTHEHELLHSFLSPPLSWWMPPKLRNIEGDMAKKDVVPKGVPKDVVSHRRARGCAWWKSSMSAI